jgi:Fic family protein
MHMIFQTPQLQDDDRRVLALIEGQRRELGYLIGHSPVRWTGLLRRNTFARALQGSNSIEGYAASVDQIDAILDDERPESLADETRRALAGYRDALTYILQTHNDPDFEIGAQLIKSLHYMILSYDMAKLPGHWRQRPIFVVREPSGETVYEGPDAKLVPGLANELVAQIRDHGTTHATVLAAMAHLNLTMIHPFKDGNGRMARALQTLVLARQGVTEPIFSSIEEWLGRNTEAYYAILQEVGQGRWQPNRDALPWVRFCLKAHYQQAATLIRRNREIGSVWEQISPLAASHGIHERGEAALVNAAFGLRIRSSAYRKDNEISVVVASRDLKRLCDAGLLVPVGEKRGRYYVAAEKLRLIRESVRGARRAPDPYDLIRAEAEPRFPGLS